MYEPKILLCVIVIISSFPLLDANSDAHELENKRNIEQYMYNKVVRMTGWILKDATLKLRQATRVQEKYKTMISYQLGTIAAGIQEKFSRMLNVYRTYCNLTEHRHNWRSAWDVFNGYHLIKGDFNEIRLEKNMYYEIVNKHKAQIEAQQKLRNKIRDLLGFKFRPTRPSIRAPAARQGQTFNEEAEYKKNLRFKKWAEKWKNFIPEVEGIDINEEAVPKF